jgi:hypothetical protein
VHVLWVPQVKKKNMMDVLLVLCSQSFLGTLLEEVSRNAVMRLSRSGYGARVVVGV